MKIIMGFCVDYTVPDYMLKIEGYKEWIVPPTEKDADEIGYYLFCEKKHDDTKSYVMARIDDYNNLLDWHIVVYDGYKSITKHTKK